MKFRNLLFVTAMEEELTAARSAFAPRACVSRRFGRTFPVDSETYAVSSGTREIHLVRSGVGGVNAALTVVTMLDHLAIDAVILLGVGGALVPSLEIGSLVLSRDVVQHDSYSSLDGGHFRMKPGTFILSVEEGHSTDPRIPADSELLAHFTRLLSDVAPRVGTLMSGGEFAGTRERKALLASLDQNALLVDMEAAGLAQVCLRAGVPFLVAKTAADRLNPDGSIENDFLACLDSAARNAANLVSRAVAD